MAIMFLCNTPVYDIAKDEVLNKVLCPFVDSSNTKKSYECWRSHRVYLKTNRLAEQIVEQSGGIDTREAKRRLSLSDGYWIQYKHDIDTLFESITPYINNFSEARIVSSAKSSSVPELVVGGSQPKMWVRDSDDITYMRKSELPEQVHAEMLAVKLALKCGIPCMNAFIELDYGRIYAKDYTNLPKGHGVINLINMTSPSHSLLQFDQLGIGVLGYDPVNVAAAYSKCGVKGNTLSSAVTQIVFDAVVGNTDRETNNSNWAVLMNNNTGERQPSPMYDFNWAALNGQNTKMLDSVIASIQKAGADSVKNAVTQAKLLSDACAELGLTLWQSNAQRIIEFVQV
jgi:hypothetical protein